MEQVLAAHHVGDALQRVIERNRQVIARRRVLAGEHHVAPGGGVGEDPSSLPIWTATALGPRETCSTRRRLFPPPLRGRDREGGIRSTSMRKLLQPAHAQRPR